MYLFGLVHTALICHHCAWHQYCRESSFYFPIYYIRQINDSRSPTLRIFKIVTRFHLSSSRHRIRVSWLLLGKYWEALLTVEVLIKQIYSLAIVLGRQLACSASDLESCNQGALLASKEGAKPTTSQLQKTPEHLASMSKLLDKELLRKVEQVFQNYNMKSATANDVICGHQNKFQGSDQRTSSTPGRHFSPVKRWAVNGDTIWNNHIWCGTPA